MKNILAALVLLLGVTFGSVSQAFEAEETAAISYACYDAQVLGDAADIASAKDLPVIEAKQMINHIMRMYFQSGVCFSFGTTVGIRIEKVLRTFTDFQNEVVQLIQFKVETADGVIDIYSFVVDPRMQGVNA